MHGCRVAAAYKLTALWVRHSGSSASRIRCLLFCWAGRRKKMRVVTPGGRCRMSKLHDKLTAALSPLRSVEGTR